MDISTKVCTACRGDEPVLTRDQIVSYLAMIKSDWQVKQNPDRITREFKFEDFKTALAFVNHVGELAEEQGHHPNIRIYDYNKVEIELYTHKIGGLHENDFIMAAKIDKIT